MGIGGDNPEPTLRRNGHLVDSVNARPYGKSSVMIASNLEYAAVHQFGSKDGKIPALPFITLTEQDIQDIVKRLASFL